MKARPLNLFQIFALGNQKNVTHRLASHGLDEDLFKRRLDQFEAINGGCRGGLVQQLLRVAVRFEPDFGMAGEVFRLGNFIAVQE